MCVHLFMKILIAFFTPRASGLMLVPRPSVHPKHLDPSESVLHASIRSSAGLVQLALVLPPSSAAAASASGGAIGSLRP